MDAFEMTFGQRLEKVRGKRTRKEVASVIGVSTSALQNYEGDKREVSSGTLAAVHREFGVDLNWLVTGEKYSPIQTAAPIDEVLLKRVLAVAIDEIKFQKDIANMSGAELASSLVAVYRLVLSKADAQGKVTDVQLKNLPEVVRFLFS